MLPSRSFDAMKRQATIGARKNRQRPGNLREQIDPEMCRAYKEAQAEANNWPTPRETASRDTTYDRGKCNLREVVHNPKNWPTVRASEYKGTGPKGSKSQKHMLNRKYLCATVEEQDGQPAQDNPNTDGKNRGQLDPAWVEQLMGLPPGWTNFDCWVTE